MSISRASGTPCASVFGCFRVLSYDHSDDEGQMKVNYLSLCYRGSDNPAFILISGEGVLAYHPMASMEIDQSRQNDENRPQSQNRRCKFTFATE